MKKGILIITCLLLTVTLSQAQTLSDSLRVHFQFSGNAQDLSGNGNDGTVYGATLTVGRNGADSSAYAFDGTSSYITFPADSVLSTEYTYSLWIKSTTAVGNGKKVVVLGIGGADCDQSINLTNNYFSYDGVSAGGYYQIGNTYNTNDPTLPTVDTWVHITGVKSADSMKLFIDGVKKDVSATPSQDPCYSGMGQKGVIGSGVALGQFFTGAIDEVRIYSRALSDAEVSSLHNTELTSVGKPAAKITCTVYPNPSASGIFKVQADQNIETISVYSIEGKLVDGQFNSENGTFIFSKPTSGTYIMVVETEAGIAHNRVVIR